MTKLDSWVSTFCFNQIAWLAHYVLMINIRVCLKRASALKKKKFFFNDALFFLSFRSGELSSNKNLVNLGLYLCNSCELVTLNLNT